MKSKMPFIPSALVRYCKSSGYDNIDAYFIRTASHIINPYITYPCFLSFEFGIFPQCLKIAKVIPILKTGSKTEVNNYSPISILSNFSKIFEKFVVARLTNSLKKQNILHGNQGLREGVQGVHCTRAQRARKSSGFRVKFWYRTKTS